MKHQVRKSVVLEQGVVFVFLVGFGAGRIALHPLPSSFVKEVITMAGCTFSRIYKHHLQLLVRLIKHLKVCLSSTIVAFIYRRSIVVLQLFWYNS